MTTYNPNDFYPSNGAEVKSDGTIANTADGFNADGSENVVLEGVAPILFQQGTINTASGVQFPVTANINVPGKVYRKFVFAFHNATGQAISSISIIAQNVSFGSYTGNNVLINSKSVSIGSNNNSGVLTLFCEYPDPYPFLFNTPIQVQFNLGAVTTTTGTIDWAIYGI